MKYTVSLMCLVVTVVSADMYFDLVQEEWNGFKMEHGKKYENEKDLHRMKVYTTNKHKIYKHNKLHRMGLVTYKVAMNKYGDLQHHEFVRLMNGFKNTSRQNRSHVQVGVTYIPPAQSAAPDEVDWRTEGAVTPVKNQGQCGSCWSFGATGALESQYYRKTGKLVSLSEQNLIDCTTEYGNSGCDGGDPNIAFQYIKDQGGIDTEDSYPYEAKNDVCRYNPENSEAKDVGFVNIASGDEDQLKQAVAGVGPIAVAIDASQDSLRFYSSGVYYDDNCSSDNLDHAVLVVGYGSEEDGDYWLVKNSWGTNWGDEGYFKLARNRNNHCGVATRPSYPLV